MREDEAIPANPNNEYGWEKLHSERMLMAYARNSHMKARIARFQNCYGPEGEWIGGREKAPAAICRKVAEAGFTRAIFQYLAECELPIVVGTGDVHPHQGRRQTKNVWEAWQAKNCCQVLIGSRSPGMDRAV